MFPERRLGRDYRTLLIDPGVKLIEDGSRAPVAALATLLRGAPARVHVRAN
jgi:hypothetical protein